MPPNKPDVHDNRIDRLEDVKDSLLREVSSMRSKMTVLQWLVGSFLGAFLGSLFAAIGWAMSMNTAMARIETRQATNIERLQKIADDDREQDRIISSMLSATDRLVESVARLERQN